MWPSGHHFCKIATGSVRFGAGPNLGVVNGRTLWQCSRGQLNREFDMSFKKASLVAMLAVSMTGTQVLAQTATAASAPTAAARSGASTEDASELRGGAFIALLAIIAIIIGILCAMGGDDDNPVSP